MAIVLAEIGDIAAGLAACIDATAAVAAVCCCCRSCCSCFLVLLWLIRRCGVVVVSRSVVMVSRVDMFVYSSHEVSRGTRCISIERNKNHTEIKAKQQ